MATRNSQLVNLRLCYIAQYMIGLTWLACHPVRGGATQRTLAPVIGPMAEGEQSVVRMVICLETTNRIKRSTRPTVELRSRCLLVDEVIDCSWTQVRRSSSGAALQGVVGTYQTVTSMSMPTRSNQFLQPAIFWCLCRRWDVNDQIQYMSCCCIVFQCNVPDPFYYYY